MKRWPLSLPETILFVFGLIGVGYETVAKTADRPSLIVLFGAMMGLSIYQNQKRNGHA